MATERDGEEESLSANYLTASHIEILFGAGADLDSVFEELDEDGSGLVCLRSV